ncbi:MAG: hypothetical protein CV087_10760 [Candidatus Brocadia sp. WS118]|nr:MAG: hypothetical protein CV087_10760 [Candidatus Brocadia sp. WS118]
MHIVSFEIAKQLKDAGWPQSTEGYYYPKDDPRHPYFLQISTDGWNIKAPTLGELIRELPNHSIRHYENREDEKTYSVTDWETRFMKFAATPEDACALAWIALKKLEITESA